MKDLRIPKDSKEYIDLSIIDPDFKGLIIGYLYDKPIGYIQYNQGLWNYFIDIDYESHSDSYSELIDLILYLIDSRECTSFKVLEFGKP